MQNDWPEVGVDDVKADSNSALATGPFGSSISSRFFVADGVPVIRGSNLSEDVTRRLIEDGLVFVTNEKAASFRRAIVRRGDLVFTCWGTIGQVGLIDGRSRYDSYVISNKQMKLTPDPSKADSLFLYYLFSSPAMVAQVRSIGIGSSVPGFNLGQLRSLRFRLPTLNEQQAIAEVLGSLDDKIELNRQMNRTLEQMAAAIFKAWFVEFEPVKAKAAGATCFPTMPQPVFDALPTEFTDSPLGPIPKGWEIQKLNDILELNYGKALKADNRIAGSVPVFGSNGIVGWHNEHLVLGPGIVVGRKGNPGTVVWADRDFFPIDTTFYVSSNGIVTSTHYLFHMLRGLNLPALSADSAVPGLNRNMAYMSDVSVPMPSLTNAFEAMASTLSSLVTSNDDQTKTLAEIRDALLPKLLSGEIRVGAAEKIVEEVA